MAGHSKCVGSLLVCSFRFRGFRGPVGSMPALPDLDVSGFSEQDTQSCDWQLLTSCGCHRCAERCVRRCCKRIVLRSRHLAIGSRHFSQVALYRMSLSSCVFYFSVRFNSNILFLKQTCRPCVGSGRGSAKKAGPQIPGPQLSPMPHPKLLRISLNPWTLGLNTCIHIYDDAKCHGGFLIGTPVFVNFNPGPRYTIDLYSFYIFLHILRCVIY